MLARIKKGCTFAVPNNERGNVKKASLGSSLKA